MSDVYSAYSIPWYSMNRTVMTSIISDLKLILLEFLILKYYR